MIDRRICRRRLYGTNDLRRWPSPWLVSIVSFITLEKGSRFDSVRFGSVRYGTVRYAVYFGNPLRSLIGRYGEVRRSAKETCDVQIRREQWFRSRCRGREGRFVFI